MSSMSTIDAQITGWINALAGHSRALDLLMIAVTRAGVPFLVLAVAVQWWTREDWLSQRYATVACGLSFFLGLAVNQVVLLFVHCVRPYGPASRIF
jgi:undecaprenyl-diphosphatase